MKFRNRLTLSFTLLIGVAMLISGIFMVQMLEDSRMKTLKQNMLNEMYIISSLVDWPTDEEGLNTHHDKINYFTETAQILQRSADLRVTFINENGEVLGDSDYDPQTMDNHLDRVEIQAADSTEGVGFVTRYSETLNENMLYAAIPIYHGNQIDGYLRLSKSLAEVEEAAQQVWTVLLGTMTIIFVVVAFISYRISLSMTRPLENVAEVSKQLSQFNYSARVERTGKGEVGQLGTAINQMAESLQKQMKQIREDGARLSNVLENMQSGVMMIDQNKRIVLMNHAVETILGLKLNESLLKQFEEAHLHNDIIRLIRHSQDTMEPIREEITVYFPNEATLDVHMVPMKDEDHWAGTVVVLHEITAIRRLEKMRSDFVANVSHELKTPITAIKGFAETLLSGGMKDTETTQSFMQIIHDESNRLNRLVEDILELSKIESKRATVQFSPVNISVLANDTIEMLKSQASQRGIELECHAGQEIYLEADEDRLRQILINLLSNGILYTPEGGFVQLHVTATDETIRILVKDSGVGIPKKDLPRIFERFYRVDKARSRQSGGTGLGLSIVKHLVDLHKGTIKVESQVGVGTSFTIELPIIQ